MAIAGKIQDDQLVVIDELTMDAPQTREVAGLLRALDLAGVSTLITTAGHEPNIYQSARNIQNVSVSPVSDLNALKVLQPHRMVVTRAALDAIKQKA